MSRKDDESCDFTVPVNHLRKRLLACMHSAREVRPLREASLFQLSYGYHETFGVLMSTTSFFF